MLWNLLQESPYWRGFNQLSGGSPDQVMEWFRNIVASIYQLHPEVKTVEELKRVNAEVITICSKHMKANGGMRPEYGDHPNQNQNQTPVSFLAQAYDVEKQKEQRISEAKANFDAFQERYNAGLAKPQPPVLNLAVNLDEPKITNMEELVKQHLDSRNSLQLPTWNDAASTQTYSPAII